MNILFVTPRIPYPLDTGGKIRTFNLLKQARLQGNNVVLLSFVFGKELDAADEVFKELGIDVISVVSRDLISIKAVISAFMKRLPLSVAKYRSRGMAETLVNTIRDKKIDLVHFDHVHMGQYIDFVPGVPVVVDEHNVECLILKRLAENMHDPLRKYIIQREYRRMSPLEVSVCSHAFRALFVSEEDRQNYGRLGGDLKNTAVIPNGVDVEYFCPSSLPCRQAGIVPALTAGRHRPSSEDSIVFTGSMDWLPNSDAVEYFCKDILPLIWKENPEVKFYVVGKNPPGIIKQFGIADKRIIVTGSVADVRPYVERSKIFVVPLRIGGGTRLKILEAMSMKKAVVSTTIGAEGINAKDGEHLVLADAPDDFAKKVVALLKNSEDQKRLGENGCRLVYEQYDWKIIGKRLANIYKGFSREE